MPSTDDANSISVVSIIYVEKGQNVSSGCAQLDVITAKFNLIYRGNPCTMLFRQLLITGNWMQWSGVTIAIGVTRLRSLPSPQRLLLVLQAAERYNNLLPWTSHCHYLITACPFHPVHIGWPVPVGLSSSAWLTLAAPGRVWIKSVGYLPESHPAVNGSGGKVKQMGVYNVSKKEGESRQVRMTIRQWEGQERSERGGKEWKRGWNYRGKRLK